MVEINTTESLNRLSAGATQNEREGKYEDAAFKYNLMVTIEELSGFTPGVIKTTKDNETRCKTLADSQKAAEKLVRNDQLHVTPVLHFGKEGTVMTEFMQVTVHNHNEARGKSDSEESKTVDLILDVSGSMSSDDLKGKLSREKFRQTKPVEETKPHRHIPITTDSQDWYPSKGCP